MKLPIILGLLTASITASLAQPFRDTAVLQLADTKVLTAETSQAQHLNLNPFLVKDKEFDFGALLNEISFVPLETTAQSRLGQIRKVVTTAEHIYIIDDLDEWGIAIFTRQGQFVKRIPNGKKPEQLYRLYDIDFNTQTNELIAYKHSFLLIFDKEGNFLRFKYLPIGFLNMAATPDGYVLKSLVGQNINLGDKSNYRLQFINKDLKLNAVALPDKESKAFSAKSYLYRVADLVKITAEISDTIYQYNPKDNKLAAEFILDYDHKLPRSYIYGKDFSIFENAIRNHNYNYCIGDYIETTYHNVFFISNKTANVVVYRDKDSGNMVGGGIAQSKQGLPFLAFPDTFYDDQLIKYYYPGENDYEVLKEMPFLSEANKKKSESFKKGDNPILIYYTLNKF
ncbi:6-bladed beta-propeller [Capnocytophaga leadbetteri]|uniref:6-bladed beta-propeller n=1 Tax=Capnocytophaga leadbetteri TaxID=327575 RepID=UPI0028894CD1|nr:6-bladed beta-propeller [Capnocytophaga leadbetteri]